MHSIRRLLIVSIGVAFLSRGVAPQRTTQQDITSKDTDNVMLLPARQTRDPRPYGGLPKHWTIRWPFSNSAQEAHRVSRRSEKCDDPPCVREQLYIPLTDFDPSPEKCVNPPCTRTVLTVPLIPSRNGGSNAQQPTPSTQTDAPVTDSPPTQGDGCYLCQFESNCGARYKDDESKRIRGGKLVRPGEWTFTVALMMVGEPHPFCGGTLITDRHVLTAAHCLEGLRATDMRIRAGYIDIDMGNSSSDVNVETVTVHPSYDTTSWDADIAILKLVKAFPLNDRISVCCLPDERDHAGHVAQAIGWGSTDTTGKFPSQRLLQVSIGVVTNLECATKHAGISKRPITQNMVCAGRPNEDGYDTCEGDSGGPLVVENVPARRWFLEGIVSWGPMPCGDKRRPGVYTRVARFLNWIYITVE